MSLVLFPTVNFCLQFPDVAVFLPSCRFSLPVRSAFVTFAAAFCASSFYISKCCYPNGTFLFPQSPLLFHQTLVLFWLISFQIYVPGPSPFLSYRLARFVPSLQNHLSSQLFFFTSYSSFVVPFSRFLLYMEPCGISFFPLTAPFSERSSRLSLFLRL